MNKQELLKTLDELMNSESIVFVMVVNEDRLGIIGNYPKDVFEDIVLDLADDIAKEARETEIIH
jgi:predicted regulator of Ras-like GTPase activity (Roadblock/LC7/MglB family)